MAWFKVDDGFGQHPKVLRIPRKTRMAALGLWLTAGTWSAQQETDGLIPDYMLDEFGADTALADTLVACGLWVKVSQRDKTGHPADVRKCPNGTNSDVLWDSAGHLWDSAGHLWDSAGYQFHDWDNYQPLRADLAAKREEERKRKAEWRAKQKAERAATSTNASNTNSNASESVPTGQTRTSAGTIAVSEHPDPTRPDPTPNLKQAKETRREPAAFIEFYEHAYPKKVDRKRALTAWRRAIKEVDPQLLTDKAHQYAEATKGRDPKYIKAPASWLNAGSWENEELTTAPHDPATDRYMRLPE